MSKKLYVMRQARRCGLTVSEFESNYDVIEKHGVYYHKKKPELTHRERVQQDIDEQHFWDYIPKR